MEKEVEKKTTSSKIYQIELSDTAILLMYQTLQAALEASRKQTQSFLRSKAACCQNQ